MTDKKCKDCGSTKLHANTGRCRECWWAEQCRIPSWEEMNGESEDKHDREVSRGCDKYHERYG